MIGLKRSHLAAKRDTDIGQFMDQQEVGKPFKGVAKEKDARRS